jgi:hypothetical protein
VFDEVPFAREHLKTLGGAEGLARRQVPDSALQRLGGNGDAGRVRAVWGVARSREQARCVPGVPRAMLSGDRL